MTDNETDETTEELTDEQKAEIARRAFGRQLRDHGCILDRERTDNWFANDAATRSAIRVEGLTDEEVFGVKDVIRKMKKAFPELFRASGNPLPGGTPPTRADLDPHAQSSRVATAAVTGKLPKPEPQRGYKDGIGKGLIAGPSPIGRIVIPDSIDKNLRSSRKKM